MNSLSTERAMEERTEKERIGHGKYEKQEIRGTKKKEKLFEKTETKNRASQVDEPGTKSTPRSARAGHSGKDRDCRDTVQKALGRRGSAPFL